VEDLGNQVLAHLGPVRVRGVDQVDAQHHDAAEEALGLLWIVRSAPNAVPRDPHGAEAEAVNLQVSADAEGIHLNDASERRAGAVLTAWHPLTHLTWRRYIR
jgi:hypothetical protein